MWPWMVRLFIVFLLLSPILFLLSFVQDWQWISLEQWGYVLVFTIYQALLSAFFSLSFGYWGAWFLLKLKGYQRRWCEVFYLIPHLVPSLFVIVSTMSFFDVLGGLPQGLFGIVILHGVIHTGIVSVIVARALENRLGSLTDLARVDGVKRFLFHTKIAIPLLKRDLALIGFFIFSTCFTSFSIPLVVGGVTGSTIEVLIYEKVRDPEGWGAVIYLSTLQILIVFGFSLLIQRFKLPSPSPSSPNLKHWSPPLTMLPGTLCSLLVIFGQVWKIPEGFRQWNQLQLDIRWLQPLVVQTLCIGLGVGISLFILLALISYSGPSRSFQRFLIGYTSPSAALTGFVFYMIFMGEWIELKLILGITLLSLPLCYKFIVDSVLTSIENQIQVARTMGASHFQVFRGVVWPQVRSSCGLAAGLGAFWACGDFAFTSMVVEKEITLALKIKSLLGAYRLELSVLLSWIVLISGGVLFSLFRSLGRVTYVVD